MGVRWADNKIADRSIRVSRSTRPRVVPGATSLLPGLQRAGEGRTSPASLPSFSRHRSLRWSDHRRALRALRHIWRT